MVTMLATPEELDQYRADLAVIRDEHWRIRRAVTERYLEAELFLCDERAEAKTMNLVFKAVEAKRKVTGRQPLTYQDIEVAAQFGHDLAVDVAIKKGNKKS